MANLTYLSAYNQTVQTQVAEMLARGTLGDWLLSKYPHSHDVRNDNELREYVQDIKQRYLKKSAPLSKVTYDNKIHVVNHALGLHTYVTRVQGGKLKSKNELRVAAMFKQAPEAFLRMIVVHELAHLKEKDHNKSFYQLCQHMLPDYHQLEFETRVYLTYTEQVGPLYQAN